MADDVPSFATSGLIGAGTLSAANTSLIGAGTVVTLLTGGTTGSRVESIRAKAIAATTAGRLRFFIFNSSGTFVHLLQEMAVTALTPAATVASWESQTNYGTANFLIIPANWTIRAATYNAESFTAAVIYTE